MWKNLIDVYHLHSLSTSQLASSPGCTYSSGGSVSTIDYIIGNQDTAQGVSSFWTCDDHPLNTSDHLPVCCLMDLHHLIVKIPQFFLSLLLIGRKQKTDQRQFLPHLWMRQSDPLYYGFDSLQLDMVFITDQLLTIANQCIPERLFIIQVHDQVLTDLCCKSRSAFHK